MNCDIQILIWATKGDGELLAKPLRGSGMEIRYCADVDALVSEVARGAGAILLDDENLIPTAQVQIDQLLRDQPPWSDLPVIVMISRQAGARAAELRSLFSARMLVLIERPTTPDALLSVVQSALQSRRRQYELRDLLAELRTANRSLEQRATQLANLASQFTLTEQHERRRLARVMHDHLQQLLVGAKFGVEVLLGRKSDEQQHNTMRKVLSLLEESIQVSRSLASDLSPPILHEGGLGIAMKWLCRWMRDKQSLHVELQLDEQAETPREDIRVLLFECARAILMASAKRAAVGVVLQTQLQDDRVLITIHCPDVQIGPEDLQGSGEDSLRMGLFGIRERLALLGGSLDVRGDSNSGTFFLLAAPVHAGKPALPAPATERASYVSTAPVTVRERQAGAPPTIRVLLVDDHVVMREGLSLLLAEEPDIEIVGEASDGHEAVCKARELRPDVILMDFSMPGMNGVEATRIIHADLPSARIIGLSMYEEADRAAAMLDAGAAAYVTKSGRLDSLLAAIRKGAKTTGNLELDPATAAQG